MSSNKSPDSENNEKKSKETSSIDPKSNVGIIQRAEKLGGLALHGLRRRVTKMDPYILSKQSKEDFFETFKESGIDSLITRVVWHELQPAQPPQPPPSSKPASLSLSLSFFLSALFSGGWQHIQPFISRRPSPKWGVSFFFVRFCFYCMADLYEYRMSSFVRSLRESNVNEDCKHLPKKDDLDYLGGLGWTGNELITSGEEGKEKAGLGA